MPKINAKTEPSHVTETGEKRSYREVNSSDIRTVAEPVEAQNVYIRDNLVGTVYRSSLGTSTRCVDRGSLPDIPGILESAGTDNKGNKVYSLDRIGAHMQAAMRELGWLGKEAKPLSAAQKEYRDLLVKAGVSEEEADRKARKL